MSKLSSDLPRSRLIDSVADEFESAWAIAPTTPKISLFLMKVPFDMREELLGELVRVDWEIRSKRGSKPVIDDYQRELNGCRELESATWLSEEWWQRLERTVDANATNWDPPGDISPSAGGGAATTSDAGHRIGKYVITGQIDPGGLYVIWRGVHPNFHIDVAIKTPRDPGQMSRSLARQLMAEGKILSSLNHPNIARVFDLDLDENGIAFLAMEFVPGRNLKQVVDDGPLKPRRAAEIVLTLARALAAAHRAGVCHLDIKPQNIILTPGDEPKLIDFGLSRLRTAWREETLPPGVVSGTVPFMPKEQALGDSEHIGTRSDLFSLGAVLYFLLTGRPPYPGKTVVEVLPHARIGIVDFEPLKAARVPRQLRAICRKVLACDPQDRYAGADEFADALKRFLHLRWVAPAALAVVVLAAGGGLSLFMHHGPVGQAPINQLGPSSELPPAPAPEAIVGRLSLEIQHKDQDWADITAAGRIHFGDKISARATIAPGFYGAMILFDRDQPGNNPPGIKVKEICGPNDSLRTLEIPRPQGPNLGGEPGTKVILVVARRSSPITLDDVLRVWPNQNNLPVLPIGIIMEMTPDNVYPKSRDISDSKDPIGAVNRELDTLRKSLLTRFQTVQAFAFSYDASEK